MKYISIDIETTGLDPLRHQVLEVGAVYDNGKALEELPTFRALIYHDEIVGDPVALVMNAGLLVEMNAWGMGMKNHDRMWTEAGWLMRPICFKRTFAAWLQELGIEKPVLAGKNLASLDLPFLERLGFVPYYRRILDPAILYLRRHDTEPPNLATCLKRGGLDEEVTHRAVSDAMQVVKLLRGKL